MPLETAHPMDGLDGVMQAKTRAPFADLAGVYKNIRHPQFTPAPLIFRLEEARGPEGGSNLKIKERSHA